ncbi:hypothetical protein [Lapidilactobacillus wuchangensis]|uniref:hypothetical protein n=1 Tax=Lapidilactobacillus wuchangensis TaxID=2486001 RepID=UPI000F799495|nr:hypothetical protein [Lapidilactobacillus wuchangensis]
MTTKADRGYLAPEAQLPTVITKADLLTMIQSPNAVERTTAARLVLQKQLLDVTVAKALLGQLKVETKLYAKIEICQTLQHGDSAVIKLMLPLLGQIGSNQLHSWSQCVPSKKKSYPLPRDIIARTLARTEPVMLSVMVDFLDQQATVLQARELIDAIGFKCFYTPALANDAQLTAIYQSLMLQLGNNILTWKFTTLLSAFKTDLALAKLAKLKQIDNATIQAEINRSEILIRQGRSK